MKEAEETGGTEALLHKDRRRTNLESSGGIGEQAILAFASSNPPPVSFVSEVGLGKV
jgi:hypothetical protein